MRTVSRLGLVALALCLATGSKEARADFISDVLSEAITDQNGNTVVKGGVFGINENQENGTPVTINVAPLTVDFIEGGSIISDRVHFDSYQVTLTSDVEGGPPLTPRPGAVKVTSEAFGVWGFTAASDGNTASESGPSTSDSLVISSNGLILGSETLTQDEENKGINTLTATIGPIQFDVYENGTVSDYVDLGQINLAFTSSDSLQPLPSGPDGTVVEDPVKGGSLDYDLAFASDAVPEPASLTLLGIGSLGLIGYGWRRRKQSAS